MNFKYKVVYLDEDGYKIDTTTITISDTYDEEDAWLKADAKATELMSSDEFSEACDFEISLADAY